MTWGVFNTVFFTLVWSYSTGLSCILTTLLKWIQQTRFASRLIIQCCYLISCLLWLARTLTNSAEGRIFYLLISPIKPVLVNGVPVGLIWMAKEVICTEFAVIYIWLHYPTGMEIQCVCLKCFKSSCLSRRGRGLMNGLISGGAELRKGPRSLLPILSPLILSYCYIATCCGGVNYRA